MKKTLFAIIVMIILGYVVYSNSGDRAFAPMPSDNSGELIDDGNTIKEPVGGIDSDPSGTILEGQSTCASIGGTLDAINGECLSISSSACQEIGGTFNECASACRNDPTVEVCTMQCVQVCEM